MGLQRVWDCGGGWFQFVGRELIGRAGSALRGIRNNGRTILQMTDEISWYETMVITCNKLEMQNVRKILLMGRASGILLFTPSCPSSRPDGKTRSCSP
ncbi:hypothetical protein MPTK1_3g06050 [Marchantia polymorpha subsp. ruderalis]